MNASVEPLEGSMLKVTVTVPADEVDKAIAAAYKEVAGQIRIPGFRKGKVPRPVIDTQVGKGVVMARAAEELVASTFPAAIEDLGIIPAEPSEIDEIDEVTEGADYTYEAEVLGRPEIEIDSADGLTVEAPPATVDDAAIDEQIDYLRDRYASLEPVEDRGVEPGDFAVIAFTGLIDGEPYDNNEVDGLLYELGAGQMPQEFEDAMMGARPGDTVSSEFTIPETSSVPEFVGRTATFETTISEIKAKVLPEVDDEFAASAGGYESAEAMREDVRLRLADMRESARRRAVEANAKAALAERAEIEVPEALIKAKEIDILGEFRKTLEQRQMTLQQYMEASGLSREEIEADIHDEAEQRLREELALEALFRLQGMEVTGADIDQALDEMADSYEMSRDEIQKILVGRSLMPEIRLQIMHGKATEWLVDNVEVTDVEPQDAAEAEAKPSRQAKGKKSKAAKPADEAVETAAEADAEGAKLDDAIVDEIVAEVVEEAAAEGDEA